MNNIMKVEWYKLKSKKDVCVISVLLILLPIIVTLCLKFKVGTISMTGMDDIAIPEFVATVWMIMKMLFLPYLVFTYLAISTLGKEVEKKTISIELLKSSRKNVVLSKMIISGLMTIIVVLLLFLGAILGSTMLKDTVKQTFQTIDGDWNLFLFIIVQVLAMVVLVSAANLIGTFCGNLKAMLITLGLIILQKGLATVGILESIMPVSVFDPSTYLSGASGLSQSGALKYNAGVVAYAIVLILIINAITYIVWKKKDFM